MTCVLVGGGGGKFGRREESDMTKEAEIGGRQAQSLEHQELCEAEEARGMSPGVPAGSALLTPVFWPSEAASRLLASGIRRINLHLFVLNQPV